MRLGVGAFVFGTSEGIQKPFIGSAPSKDGPRDLGPILAWGNLVRHRSSPRTTHRVQAVDTSTIETIG